MRRKLGNCGIIRWMISGVQICSQSARVASMESPEAVRGESFGRNLERKSSGLRNFVNLAHSK